MSDVSAVAAPAPSTRPWVEKYRPKKLDDVAHQEEAVRALRQCMATNNLPHLLFYGPPGTGKTSAILAVCRELYGPDMIRNRVLELNASDERGISVVRDKIKSFASVAVGSQKTAGYPSPPYKIIILDEADSMTSAAQSALRRMMESYSKITRFCIICNYVTRIIDPITSRCAKFRFKPLPGPSVSRRLEDVSQAERIVIEQSAILSLVDISQGDLRKAITLLQSAHRMHPEGGKITHIDIAEVACVVPQTVVRSLLSACTQSFANVQSAARDALLSGYSIAQLVDQLHTAILAYPGMREQRKAEILLRLGEMDKKLTDGADEHLQLLDTLSFISARMH